MPRTIPSWAPADAITGLGPFEILFDGAMAAGIPAVSWTLKAGADPGFGLFDFADRLRVYGWQVPAYTLPADCGDRVVQRILVRNGVSRDLGALLIGDFETALARFGKHPVGAPLAASEASGFHH